MSAAEKHPTATPLNDDLSACYQQAEVVQRQQGQCVSANDLIAEEVPVALVYNGISHAVMMSTPADLEDFALGFSLSEGIVQHAGEVYGIELHKAETRYGTGIEVQLSIAAQRQAELKQQRRNLTGRTGCGLCGAESLQQAIRPIGQVPAAPLPGPTALENALDALREQQPLQALTGASHGAAWCDMHGKILCLREDIGRHNALDKLLGALTRQDRNLHQGFVLVSSRASYEMVYKTARCGISTLVAVSAPTRLACDIAAQSGLNLIGFARPGRHVIYHQQPATR